MTVHIRRTPSQQDVRIFVSSVRKHLPEGRRKNASKRRNLPFHGTYRTHSVQAGCRLIYMVSAQTADII